MERIVIRPDEIAQTLPQTGGPSERNPALPSPIPVWARIALAPLVLVLPLLALLTIVLRVIQRNLPPRDRMVWNGYFATLLAISGFLYSILIVMVLSTGPTPSMVSDGLSELDNTASFPLLPSKSDLRVEEISTTLKPLVTVITPESRLWFSSKEVPSSAFGAGIILEADHEGYLVATARHVVDEDKKGEITQKVLVASTSGTWASAKVVARHKSLDLLLIWLPRASGNSTFTLPVSAIKDVRDGESIFVIGHPQGLRFTLSTGIISRKDQDTLQISAPISPGNSGGPLFDARGNLLGIVTSMVDRNQNPNAENLNFAVRADALLDLSEWTFSGDGHRHLEAYEHALSLISH